ncbi:tryptophan synthase subunit alpha [Oceanicoccus sagamiensis]|uniref:Tryptophan synthase alpha chain n=1 Tax=Oceanicoccus sagamiensis TaxID=716816 RepID=A0A1X9ND09_9GAMM|nr:tryptophan synthase subunit alpha [Oceanicoccus sagamiensis]ARN75928.1 tryptophan synthase subunit alpha [Oceanicoccus sagamiensis]
MSRITACMQALEKQGRKALIPYIVAGDPAPDFTVAMMHQLVKSGSDIIELGVPFSDPMAEGPVIQLAHERALEHHVSLTNILAMVKEFRQQDQTTPVVLMGYANPVMKMGFDHFANAALESGVDGLLTVDLPPEEADELNAALKRVDIDSIFLIAPTTTEERIKSIASLATGYLYYVSLKGVTGAGHLDINSVQEKLTQIKAITDLPVAVGFGIKDNDSAVSISRLAEGVVVGSALVNKVIELNAAGGDNIAEQSAALIDGMRKAMDAA